MCDWIYSSLVIKGCLHYHSGQGNIYTYKYIHHEQSLLTYYTLYLEYNETDCEASAHFRMQTAELSRNLSTEILHWRVQNKIITSKMKIEAS